MKIWIRHVYLVLLGLFAWMLAGFSASWTVTAAEAEPEISNNVELRSRVSRLLGLPVKRETPVVELDAADLHQAAAEELRESGLARDLKTNEAVLRRIGIWHGGTSPDATVVDGYSAQVDGYYAARDGRILIRAALSSDARDEILYHAMVHDLQAQNLPIERMTRAAMTKPDALRALRSVLEGQAVHISRQLTGLYHEVTRLRPPSLFAPPTTEAAAVADGDASVFHPCALSVAGGPMVRAGAAFAAEIEARFGSSSAIFYSLPSTMEQVIHLDKYLQREPAIQASLDGLFAQIPGAWRVTYESTLGELNVASWLGGVPGSSTSSGWAGDRLAGITTSDQHLFAVWRILWDTDDDAQEFFQAAKRRLRYRFPIVRLERHSPQGLILIQGEEAHSVVRKGAEVRIISGVLATDLEPLLALAW